MNSFAPQDNVKDIHATLIEEASALGVMPAKLMIEGGNMAIGSINYWSQPTLSDVMPTSARAKKLKLADDRNTVCDLCWSMSEAIQFPVNTIYAHAIGVVASAMSKSFKFEYGHGEKPVNLYVVTAQPPSTGKSGVNEILTEPVHEAFDAINQTAQIERKKSKIRISALKNEMKEAKNEQHKFALEDELTDLYKSHDKNVVYTYALDDATPEAVAKMALKQKGMFNIISAEADAINIILGGVYSDKKSNFGIFLKGWDSERHIVARASQEVISGTVTGNICVIAQDESIKTILEAGESGRGISERFLMVREDTHLGKRTFGGERKRIKDELIADYAKMIFNIVREEGIVLSFSEKSLDMINEYRSELEPEMGDNGRYNNNMMRGFIGKADKQIMKISCVLHTIANWKEGGSRKKKINDSTVKKAIKFFQDIVESYIAAADELGFTGYESEYKKLEEKLIKYAEKNKMALTISQLRDSVKNVKPFTGTPNLMNRIKNVLLPLMEENNLCVVHKGKIHINPHLKC